MNSPCFIKNKKNQWCSNFDGLQIKAWLINNTHTLIIDYLDLKYILDGKNKISKQNVWQKSRDSKMVADMSPDGQQVSKYWNLM